MDKFVELLRNLKKKDKITKNVLMIIADSQKQYKEEIAKTILSYYKDSINKESVRDFVGELCVKEEEYLDFFQRYSKVFEDAKEGELYRYLEESKKKVKNDSKEDTKEDSKRVKNEEATNASTTDVSISYNILYPPKQCKVCGLRYTEDNELYTIHMDDHFRKSRALEEKETISREFFSTYESWIKSVERIVLNLKVDKVEKIVHRGSSVFCSICSGKIETVWDDEEDEFILKDCVEIGEEDPKKFIHKSCVV
ncbi:Polyadenylation and cleavage factor like protein 4 [Nosema granulosis]|uniref:Polyadenylation and cleavage factor like protein 4 n=1 Tax=Nosema granulosis TaxID=83296 RepID=A0A9P6GWK3_9MICR|nr:Polyadenylation and cleavage factor like protein 4 [Nosema granulosis]